MTIIAIPCILVLLFLFVLAPCRTMGKERPKGE